MVEPFSADVVDHRGRWSWRLCAWLGDCSFGMAVWLRRPITTRRVRAAADGTVARIPLVNLATVGMAWRSSAGTLGRRLIVRRRWVHGCWTLRGCRTGRMQRIPDDERQGGDRRATGGHPGPTYFGFPRTCRLFGLHRRSPASPSPRTMNRLHIGTALVRAAGPQARLRAVPERLDPEPSMRFCSLSSTGGWKGSAPHMGHAARLRVPGCEKRIQFLLYERLDC